MRRWPLLLVGAALLTVAFPARAGTVYAIVVGVNRPLDTNTIKLHYADDDALLFHELLSRLGHSVLLVDPDESTRRVHQSLPRTMTPSRENLRSAARAMLEQVRAAKARGDRPILYFIYSGHGDVKNNEGYLALADGRLTSSELASWILEPSAAEANHVVIDACRSFFIVQEKRAGGLRRPIGQRFHTASSLLQRFPRTGFLLSTSSAQSSHEWEEFQAGIFSHEVRSGLLGAADVNRDGRVSYSEMRAFIDVANSAIPNERFRPSIFVRPPENDGSRALLEARPRETASLTVPAQRPGRYLLEDSRGVRLADLHSDASAPVTLLLPRGGRLYLHDLDRGLEYLLDQQAGELALASMWPRRSSYRAKGAAHEAFASIFRRPFGRLAYRESICRYAEGESSEMVRGDCVECECRVCTGSARAPSHTPPHAAAPAVVAARPFWETVLELYLTTTFYTRSFDLTPPFPGPLDPPYHYRMEVARVPAVGLALELHPLATLRRTAARNLGVRVRYQRSVGLYSRLADDPMATTWQRVEAGLHYRWSLTGRVFHPVLSWGAGGGRDSFEVDWSHSRTPVLLPNVQFSYLNLSLLKVDLPLVQQPRFRLGVFVGLDYLYAFAAGDVEASSEAGYGSATTHGVDIEGGVYLQVRFVAFRLVGAYRRFGLDFGHECWTTTAHCQQAGGAIDEHKSVSLLGGFAY